MGDGAVIGPARGDMCTRLISGHYYMRGAHGRTSRWAPRAGASRRRPQSSRWSESNTTCAPAYYCHQMYAPAHRATRSVIACYRGALAGAGQGLAGTRGLPHTRPARQRKGPFARDPRTLEFARSQESVFSKKTKIFRAGPWCGVAEDGRVAAQVATRRIWRRRPRRRRRRPQTPGCVPPCAAGAVRAH